MSKILLGVIKEDMTMVMSIKDMQEIERLPKVVKALIKTKLKGKHALNKSGLPRVEFIGEGDLKVIGAFNYGELGFVEMEGDWDRHKQESMEFVYPYMEDLKDVNELKAGRKKFLRNLPKTDK